MFKQLNPQANIFNVLNKTIVNNWTLVHVEYTLFSLS